MAIQTLNTIKQWFKTSLKPSQQQFWDTWDSFRHKFEKVPVKDIEGIDELLLTKADKTVLDNHLADKNAHAPQVNTDWNSESGFSQLLNKPEFKSINGETIVGSGDISIDVPSQNLQSVLDVNNKANKEIVVQSGSNTVWLNPNYIALDNSNASVQLDTAYDLDLSNNTIRSGNISLGSANAVTGQRIGFACIKRNPNSQGSTNFTLKQTNNEEDYTLATTSDFKTINGESIVGDGDIVIDGDSQDLQQTLDGGKTWTDLTDPDKPRFFTVSDTEFSGDVFAWQGSHGHFAVNGEEGQESAFTFNGGINVYSKPAPLARSIEFRANKPATAGRLIFELPNNKPYTSVESNINIGIYKLATTSDFKTINGESIVGEGDLAVTADIPDGVLKIAGGGALDGTFRNLTDNLGNPTRLWVNNTSITSVGGDNTLNNVSFGSGSMRSVSSGTDNTAFGTATLSANTSGGQNTAIGDSALSANITGSYNTAVGGNSLLANTEGSNNVAFGNGALFLNTSGNENVALGHGSLSYNISGNSNIAIGYAALLKNESFSNLAIGTRSMPNNVNGSTNIAIGEDSLQNNINGSNNIAIGFKSLLNTTSSSENIAIGLSAGRYTSDNNTNNISSYNSIFLGSRTMPLKDGGSNEIVIGDSAAGSGNNSVTLGNTNITKTILRGAVSAKSYKLESLNTAPASSSDTGVLGEIRVTADYIYVCTAANTWVRSALTTW